MYYFGWLHSAQLSSLCSTLLLKCGNAKSYIHSACVILHHTSSGGLHFKLQLWVKPIFLPIISKAHFMPAMKMLYNNLHTFLIYLGYKSIFFLFAIELFSILKSANFSIVTLWLKPKIVNVWFKKKNLDKPQYCITTVVCPGFFWIRR